jgi:hypothetical protein
VIDGDLGEKLHAVPDIRQQHGPQTIGAVVVTRHQPRRRSARRRPLSLRSTPQAMFGDVASFGSDSCTERSWKSPEHDRRG